MLRSSRSLLGTIALLFAVLFTIIAAGQYWFVSRKLREATKQQLWESAEDIREDIAFQTSWDLTGYRRTSSESADMFVVLSDTGTVVDAVGYVQGILPKVSFPFSFEYERPFRAKSDVGEDWLFYVRRLKDGMAILGARGDGLPADVEQRIETTAKRFGDTVAQATRVKERSIDELFDYAVIDGNGGLRESMTGLPLRTAAPQAPLKGAFVPERAIDGDLYAMVEDPIVDKSGRLVGLVEVFKEITDEQRVLRETAVFNSVVTVVIWFVTVLIASVFLKRMRREGISCAQLPFLDESDSVEFKSSLRCDVRTGKASKEIERQVVKAAAGFLNSERGGTLVIGINDRKEIVGLEADFQTFKSLKPDRDGFELALGQVLGNGFGEARRVRHLKVRFCSLSGKEVCLVEVAPANEPVYVHDENGRPTLYVRMGNATRPLIDVKEAVAYAAERWPTPVFHWPIHFRSSSAQAGA